MTTQVNDPRYYTGKVLPRRKRSAEIPTYTNTIEMNIKELQKYWRLGSRYAQSDLRKLVQHSYNVDFADQCESMKLFRNRYSTTNHA